MKVTLLAQAEVSEAHPFPEVILSHSQQLYPGYIYYPPLISSLLKSGDCSESYSFCAQKQILQCVIFYLELETSLATY